MGNIRLYLSMIHYFSIYSVKGDTLMTHEVCLLAHLEGVQIFPFLVTASFTVNCLVRMNYSLRDLTEYMGVESSGVWGSGFAVGGSKG